MAELAGTLRHHRPSYEYAVLVTSLELEVLTVAQLYRARGDAENNFDELKNQRGDTLRIAFAALRSIAAPGQDHPARRV